MNNQTHSNKRLIQIEQLCKFYTMGGETVKALDQITLSMNHGDFTAIIGPSGSGKSTLMNMLGCLDSPTSGEYWLDGQQTNQFSDNRLAEIRNKKIGFIFQGFNLLSKLTAIENVELPLIYRGLSNRDRKQFAYEALEKVGLADRLNHRPVELSGGQQQRVAIARAIAGNRPILLADEPTGALDTRTGAEVLEVMKGLNDQGHTIIIITHDLQIANQAKRIIRIQDGKLLEGGGEAA